MNLFIVLCHIQHLQIKLRDVRENLSNVLMWKRLQLTLMSTVAKHFKRFSQEFCYDDCMDLLCNDVDYKISITVGFLSILIFD